jgi:alpha-tubulin suppressor-like RCC1 family protein
VYTTGSSEYGQLGNGETGQYFISANKLGFANCNVFTRRTTFCHAPKEKLHTSNERAEVVPIEGCEDIRIQNIACGKHHTLALEATSDQTPRVFSWGCGDYGCLGHGVQADEYFPRLIGIFSAASAMRIDLAGRGRLSVSAGAHCSLLQTANGHVYYWGKHRSVGEATMRPQLVDVLANNQHVVTHAAAGGQTVVCSTANAQTVAWGQGPHGELGLGEKKSSAKPTFVEALNGCRVADLACGYGHTLYVVRNEDKEDKAAVKKLEELDVDAIQPFVDATAAKGSKKRE